MNNFDEVVKRYNETTPIRGARASEDLRPLGRRAYWWNRIDKVSDTKYLLLDGHWAWSSSNNDAIKEATAPIMWERREDGDYMTVRSHMNNGMSVSRYAFIARYLPRGMSFTWDNGQHYVHNHLKGEKFYLPKFVGKYDYSKLQTGEFIMEKDHKLVFKVESDGSFTRVGDLVPKQTRRIDKDVDTKYKDKVVELWNWMQVVLPVLGERLANDRDEYTRVLTDNDARFWYWENRIKPEEVRAILEDEEHPKRFAFAVVLANHIDALYGNMFTVYPDSFSKLRTAIRKVGNFYKVEMV